MKRKIVFLCVFFIILFLMPELSFAGDDFGGHDLEYYLCNVLSFLTGGVGKALAAFSCIGVSLTFVSGKLAWTTVLTFAISMACIFGAPQIVAVFSSTSGKACEDFSNK